MSESGTYDAEAEALLLSEMAEACCVIILGGRRNGGFSMSMLRPELAHVMAGILRTVATKLESPPEADS